MRRKEQELLNKVNELLDTNFETLDWVWISEKNKLSENFIREHVFKIDFDSIWNKYDYPW